MRQGAPTQAGHINAAAWTAMNEAAQRAGLPLDEWLHQRLLGHLGTGERGGSVGDIADLRRRIRELTGTVNSLATPPAPEPAAAAVAAPSAPAPAAPSPATSRVEAALEDIRAQLDTLVGDSSARLRSTAARSTVARPSEPASPQPVPPRRLQAPSAASIEAAVAEIAARQRELEVAAPARRAMEGTTAARPTAPGPAEPPAAAQAPPPGRPSSARPTPPAPPTPAPPTPAPPSPPAAEPASSFTAAIDTLRGDVVRMRAALGDLAPRQAVDELQRTVSRLAGRIEASGLRDNELCATLAALRDMIATLRLPEYQSVVQGRIDALSRKLDLIAAKQVDTAAIARLQAQAGEIRHVIGRALSNDAVRQLVEQVTLLVGRVSREAGAQENALRAVLAGVDERLGQLAAHIEAQAARPAQVDLGGVHRRLDDIQANIAQNFSALRRDTPANVEQMLRGIGERLERIERPAEAAAAPAAIPVPDTAAFEALSHRIAALADRLETQHAQPNRLAGIERALNDLFIQMEETRASLVSAPSPAPSDPMPPRRAPAPPAAVAPQADRPVVSPASTQAGGEAPAARQASHRPAAAGEEPAVAAPDERRPGVPANAPAIVSASHPTAAEASAGDGQDEPGPDVERDGVGMTGTGPARIDFIAQARRAARGVAPANGPTANVPPARGPSANVPPAKPHGLPHATLGARIAEGRANRARSTRWLARIRAMLLVGVCGSALAFASWHLLSGMKEGRLRANAPSATSTARSLPVEPTPDDITGSVSPRPVAPRLTLPPAAAPLQAVPDVPLAPPMPSLPEADPMAPLPGSSSLDGSGSVPGGVPGDLPNGIGSQGLRVAALGGDPAAAYEVGHRYMEGEGVAPSAQRAAQWFGFAAARGSIPAAYRLGALHEKGAEGVPRDLPRARRLYEAAAGGGNVRAMHNLGVLLADGTAGAPDYAAAAVWFQKAASYGVRDSQYNLGVLYSRGFGVEADPVQAWRWFSLAAARGDQEAGQRRDEIAARLDADTLATARKALQLWTPAVGDAEANSGSGLQDWDLPAARKTASRG
ncbi:localization factor PodJL [Ancylobacter sp. 3268]|uniref:hypothetical protein n=1 Tax=Ancylobacter sp. 3268 TaxID=2817752 RepID=UPI0028568157|nr:hypothetical protein [Ancylobacter sp. 3268]MDR6954470.1 localization factor PodJL [Ancylobacter sp. 3268]